MLDWIPPEQCSGLSVLEQCLISGSFAVIGRRCTLDEESWHLWLSDLHSENLNDKKQRFVYQSRWWQTWNKALEHCDVLTIWTPKLCMALLISDQQFELPLTLPLPESDDARSYFDNTPSGLYRSRPGQHLWTDCSMQTLNGVQLVGAGVQWQGSSRTSPASTLVWAQLRVREGESLPPRGGQIFQTLIFRLLSTLIAWLS